uniref:N-acetylated alpha-linked acidic dipeptidase like 2 n=1 Tax=Amphiprion percula TaxID=161767 RepID=A0A3P8U1G1_AMPPE
VIRNKFSLMSIPGDSMAYRKVCDTQGGPLVGEVLHCSGGMDLDWDLDKEELQESGPSMDRMQMQHVDCQRSGQILLPISPHGRFERLQEDPNYISHFTRAPGHKGQRRLHCFLVRSFSSLSDDSEESRARYLYRQWVGLGLTDVHLSNHTVLLSLPGSTPSTITDRSSHQCFLPNGIPCDQRGPNDLPRQQFSYAAYSAAGSVQGEVVDIQYASVDDLRRAKDSLNLTNQIAVVKLGQAPLLNKLSLLSELGFGGVLLYIDPCDAPPGHHIWYQAFRVTLNPGGNPANGGWSKEAGGSLTSLLVQPISALLAKTLLSSPSTGQGDSCIPLAMPPNTGKYTKYKNSFNFFFSLFSDRYVLVGSRHDSDQGGGTSAIMNQLIAALTEQTKRGWVPDRTTVFCSWGGSALGSIGSYEWGKDNSVVLQSSAVAYVSLNSPVRGTETLRATASPTLLQLLSCIRGGNCPGPNVSSLQLPGDVSFFANQLAVPTVEFAFEQTKAEETTSFLSEAQFSAESPETLDPLFKFHETIAKMTAEAILRLVNDPVLPFYPLDIALDVQNKLKDKSAVSPPLLSSASSLRDHAAFFQSEIMRPANDPKERDPSHVRMLNDVLRDLEKSFIIPQTAPGVYSYTLRGFSLLLQFYVYQSRTKDNKTMNSVLN